MNVFLKDIECPSGTEETLNYGYHGLNIYKDGKFKSCCLYIIFPQVAGYIYIFYIQMRFFSPHKNK